MSFGASTTSNSTKYGINQTSSEGPEFLAPINFDDFHNSILDDPSLNNFPMPGHASTASYSNKTPTPRTTNTWARPEGATRTTRSNSIRQQNDANRLTGQAPTANTMMPPPPAPSSRARRQSHIPPSPSTSLPNRPPRKSIGPGVLTLDTSSDTMSKRRPSFSTRRPSVDSTRADLSTRARTRNNEANDREEAGFLLSTRSFKAKSLQPPSRERLPQEQLSTPTADSSTNGLLTPVKNNPATATTPTSSSSKRLSSMPHATGLGARTISPTDARRMKRMSMMPPAPPVPFTPPAPQNNPPAESAPTLRPRSSQSPSMIPRKADTPSSSRTTPDPNRKSYSSGMSLSSSTSYNSVRNSSGSLQPRLSQTFSSSRLPTPKPRTEASNGASEEEVPPVPAIPKAYESPKTEFDALFPPNFRKSSLPLDVGLGCSDSRRGSDSSGPSAVTNNSQDSSVHNGPRVVGTKTPETKGKQQTSLGRKGLQALKLPPLNLLPLSTPMAAKIDALKDAPTREELNPSTPQRGNMAKTPSTPLTASKAYFFGPDDTDMEPLQLPRSSTSHFLVSTSNSSALRAPSSSSAIVPLEMPSSKRNMSPYISSSLPKTSGDYSYMRHKNSEDYSQSSQQTSRLTGPRPQTQSSVFSFNTESGSRLSSTPDPEKTGPMSKSKVPTTTLRHSISKPQLASDTKPNMAKYDNMPPPRLPASATWNGLSSITTRTSPALKPAYLITRRKSSVSSLNAKQSDYSNDSNSTTLPSPIVTDPGETESASQGRQSSSILSPVHKIINSAKANSAPKPRPTEQIQQTATTDESIADEEMRRLGSKRKDFEIAAKELDELHRRACPKERVGPAQALKMASLNIFERGEIIDFKDIYFCGTQKAKKHVGDLKSQNANFGYDDDRGDYQIVIGDHLAYRYEVVDVLGKGSFGQVVRCVDHKTGKLVAVKIIRNKKRFHQQALVEVNILQKLKEWVS